jgi:hypothetical protein
MAIYCSLFTHVAERNRGFRVMYLDGGICTRECNAMAGLTGWLRSYNPPLQEVTKFQCPTCDAKYKVVRIEAAPTPDGQIICISCGGPLLSRQGKFVLKYFRIEGGREIIGWKV